MSSIISTIAEKRLLLETSMSNEIKNINVDELDFDDKIFKDYVLYVDDSTLSMEALEERKKNFSFSLQSEVVKEKDLLHKPEWLINFPFLVNKKEKLAFGNDVCIEKIKTMKILKFPFSKKW
jgi:pyruvate kinase